MKVCRRCRIEKPAIEFYRRSRTSSRLMAECKECRKLMVRTYRETERGMDRQRLANYKSRYSPPEHTRLARLVRERLGLPGKIKIWIRGRWC